MNYPTVKDGYDDRPVCATCLKYGDKNCAEHRDEWRHEAARGLYMRHMTYVREHMNISPEKTPALNKLFDGDFGRTDDDEKQMYYDMVDIVIECAEG
jgi:hypothetical protein